MDWDPKGDVVGHVSIHIGALHAPAEQVLVASDLALAEEWLAGRGWKMVKDIGVVDRSLVRQCPMPALSIAQVWLKAVEGQGTLWAAVKPATLID
jgi:hypothetical protein